MKLKDLSDHAPGELVKTIHDSYAFVPHRLPGKFVWNDALVLAVTSAEASLAHLNGLGSRLPHPERLVRMFLRREAEFSSRIEQTYAGVRTLVLFDFLEDIEEQAPSVREVENNYQLLKFSFERTRQQPLSLSLLRHMQRMLFDNVDCPPKVIGDFRKLQNWIGTSNNIRDARYVPPPPFKVQECIEGLLQFINTKGTLPTLVRTAMAHYQFEAIHPFDDGNGRVGRALILAQLTSEGCLSLPLLNPSAQMESHRREYYDLLLDVSLTGAWQPWIEYFCRCVQRESARSIEILEKLDQLRSQYHHQVRRVRLPALLAKLIDHLFGDPAVSVKSAAEILNITPQSAQRVVEKLVDAKVLTEVTGRQRNRVYLAEQIVKLFSRSPDAKKAKN